MKLLVSNVGSTSLKFKLFDMPDAKVLCESKVERVGSKEDAIFSYKSFLNGKHTDKDKLSVPDYSTGIKLFLECMLSKDMGVIGSLKEVGAVGFKTVLSRGYTGVHLLTEEVMQGMRDYLYIAPVHNAAYIEAIGQFEEVLPGIPKVGVFETAYHVTIPEERRIYNIPYEWYEKYGIQKMGYHGASHSYVAHKAKDFGPADKIISCHLGGSCSVCAIQGGKSLDSSFGFSVQSGVMHANRSGDFDPYIIPFLMDQGLTMQEITDGLSKNGGLKGISGVSNDMRDISKAAKEGNKRAELALKVFKTEVVRTIGAFYAELGGLDQLVFTGGVGEHSSDFRLSVCKAIAHFGISIDEEKNSTCTEGIISSPSSKVTVSVIAANEELGVARQAYRCITGGDA